MKVEIKSRYDASVLFSAEIDASIGESLRVRAAVVLAVKSGADLRGADLRGADLRGAYLRGAYLRGAKVDGIALVGDRPVLQIGPLGSRSDSLLAFLTEQGIRVHAGCFSGTLAEFAQVVTKTHGDNEHGREYTAAIAMIEAHASIWTPVAEAKAA